MFATGWGRAIWRAVHPGASSAGSVDCHTIADVIARMQQIDRELPRKDGVAYFNRLYLQVTEAVQAAAAG